MVAQNFTNGQKSPTNQDDETLTAMQHNTYAFAPNPTEGTPSQNANPSKYGIIAIFARVFSMLSKRKYAQIRTSIALFSTVLVTFSPTNAQALCGAPQPIYGIVSVERFGMRLPVSTRVELRTFEGDLLAVTLSNPFGWYEFADVLPCQDYSVRAIHKRLVFAPSPVLAAEFDGKGVRRDVFEIVAEAGKH